MTELRDRIGFDAGTMKLEDALDWSVSNGFNYVDFNCDIGPNHLDDWPNERISAV